MHAALRPYVTTGIAIVGASVIAVAPVTVPPPDLPAVEVAAVDTVKSLTADVELTAFVDAFIAAFPQAALQSLEFMVSTLPGAVASEIAAGRFAHVLPIAVAVALSWYDVPLAPFIDAFQLELPLPLGTFDGVVRQGMFLVDALPALLTGVLTEIAQVVDGVDTPGDLPADLISAVNVGIQNALTSFQKIIAAFGGAPSIEDLAGDLNIAETGQPQALAAFDPASFGAAVVGAFGQSVSELARLYLQALPESFGILFGNGDFATLSLLPATLAFATTVLPAMPFLQVAIDKLPFPLGTVNGLVPLVPVLGYVLPVKVALESLLSVAYVLDGQTAPGDLVPAIAGLVGNGIGTFVTGVSGFVNALIGASPVGMMAQEDPTAARTMAMSEEMPALDDPNVVPPSVNPSEGDTSVDTLTLTLDAPADDGEDPAASTEPDEEAEAVDTGDEDTSDDESQDPAVGDETSNGATDLSDGNMAEPGITDESTGEDDNGTEAASTVDDVDTTTTDTDSGSDDGSDGSGEGGSSE